MYTQCISCASKACIQNIFSLNRESLVPGNNYELTISAVDSSDPTAINAAPLKIQVDPIPTPEITKARFSDSMTQVIVSFSSATNQPVVAGDDTLCKGVIAELSLSLLGEGIRCSWKGPDTFGIYLGLNSLVQPGSQLTTRGTFVHDIS